MGKCERFKVQGTKVEEDRKPKRRMELYDATSENGGWVLVRGQRPPQVFGADSDGALPRVFTFTGYRG